MKNILRITRIIFGFFLFPILILVLHIFLIFSFDIYKVFSWFDIPMHLAGGFAVGHSYFLILNFLQKENNFKINGTVKTIFIFALVSLTAVSWEFFEFSMSYLTGMNLQGNMNDTMLDLFLGMFGGLSSAILFKKLNHKNSKDYYHLNKEIILKKRGKD